MNFPRRRFLRSLLSAAALPLTALIPLPVRAAAAGPAEGFYLVNGWILTAADVRALGLEDAAAPPGRAPRIGSA